MRVIIYRVFLNLAPRFLSNADRWLISGQFVPVKMSYFQIK